MKLGNQDIDSAVAQVKAFFEKSGASRKDVLKICLIMEEILLRYQAQFGTTHEFSVYKKNWFDMPRVIIRIAGEPFYPPHYPAKNDIDPADTILSEEIMKRLFSYEFVRMAYRYDGGCNEINFFSTKEPKPIKIPGGSINVSIILAAICSFIVGFLSQDVQNILVTEITAPILSSLMSLVITITVFMMFFSIISSICAIDDSTTLGNIGFTVIGRFFLLDLLIIALTSAISEIFFPVISISGDNSLEVGKIVGLLLSIIPTNILKAFLEANILQVTVLAFLVGICFTMLGNRISSLKNTFIYMNTLIFKVTELILKTIPLIVFLCIFKTLSTSNFSDFFVVWELVVASLIAFAAIVLSMLIWLWLKSRINITDFLKKISPVFVIAATTLSTIASIPKNIEVAKNDLHIEEKFCSFWVPLAVALFSPSVVVKMVTAAFYAVAVSGETISIMQLVMVVFLAIQLGIASPKVAGGITVSFSILLTQLGLQPELLGALMIANVINDNIFTGLNVVIHSCELYSVAHKLNFIKNI